MGHGESGLSRMAWRYSVIASSGLPWFSRGLPRLLTAREIQVEGKSRR